MSKLKCYRRKELVSRPLKTPLNRKQMSQPMYRQLKTSSTNQVRIKTAQEKKRRNVMKMISSRGMTNNRKRVRGKDKGS